MRCLLHILKGHLISSYTGEQPYGLKGETGLCSQVMFPFPSLFLMLLNFFPILLSVPVSTGLGR